MEKIKELQGLVKELAILMSASQNPIGDINVNRGLAATQVFSTLQKMETILSELEKINNYNLSSSPSSPTKEEGKKEMVNHPKHYKHCLGDTSLECIDVMEATKGWFKTMAFCELNAFKYNWRIGGKDMAPQELGKIAWYGNKAQELWKKYLKWLYPKNGHLYAIVGRVRMKNPTTGEWKDATLYTDGKGFYVRDEMDFLNKFKEQ